MEIKRYPVNLKKYLTFFQYAVEQGSALGIISQTDSLALLTHSGKLEDFEKLLNPAEDQDGFYNNFLSSDRQFIDSQANGSLAKIPLQIPESEHKLWLVGSIQNKGNKPDRAQDSATLAILNYIAECIADDYTVQKTLTDTINELTVRYEELNLLYGLDDVETNQIQFDEKQALTQIISNCCEYLNVDLGLIHAPKLKLTLAKQNTANVGFDLPGIQRFIQNELYGQIISSQTALVVNKPEELNREDSGFTSELKLIAAPIKMDKQNIDGILVIANSLKKPDFSNSDRKLADVLAAEAGKLMQARRDAVTSLLNQRGFSEKLHQGLANTKNNEQRYCLLFIDIDQFKVVNESSGHIAGDKLLNHIASIISNTLGEIFALGRLGADEFGVLLENCDLAQAERKAEALSQVINQFRFAYHNKLFDISICIGLVELSPEFDDYFVPFSLANLACSVAKEKGRGRIHPYHPSDKEMIRHETDIQWVSRINLALEEKRFQLYRQKIQPLQADNVNEAHYEILIRLMDESGNLVTPFSFLPAAERFNLMPKLDRWVIRTTLAKMSAAMKNGATSRLFCSINLSGQSFTEPGFVEYLLELISDSDVPPECLCFEVTETAAVSNLAQTVKFMEAIKKIGCFFSLDDFGSGMSSFTYLKNLPVDFLKIDGFFVKTMLTNNIDFAMVKSIHEIGHVMGLKTVAEFVEDDNIQSALTSLGVDYGQGYGIAKPEPFEV